MTRRRSTCLVLLLQTTTRLQSSSLMKKVSMPKKKGEERMVIICDLLTANTTNGWWRLPTAGERWWASRRYHPPRLRPEYLMACHQHSLVTRSAVMNQLLLSAGTAALFSEGNGRSSKLRLLVGNYTQVTQKLSSVPLLWTLLPFIPLSLDLALTAVGVKSQKYHQIWIWN